MLFAYNLITCQHPASQATLTSGRQHTAWLVSDDVGNVVWRVTSER